MGTRVHIKALDLEGVEGHVSYWRALCPLPGQLDFGPTHGEASP